MSVIGSLLETLGVSIILPLMQAIMDPGQLMRSEVFRSVARYIRIPESGLIVAMAAGCIVVYIAKNIFLIVLSAARARFSATIQKDLGVRLMKEYISRDYQFFLKTDPHQLYRGITGDVAGVYSTVYFGLRLFAELLTCIFIGFLVLATDYVIAVGMAAVGLFCILISVLLSKTRMKRLGERARYFDTKMKAAGYQAFYGIKEVMVMHKQSYFSKEYESACNELQDATVKQTVTAECPTYIFEAICVIGLIGSIGLKSLISGVDESFIPGLATIAMAAFRIMPSLGRIANYANNIMFQTASLNAAYQNFKDAEAYQNQVRQIVHQDDNNHPEFEHTIQIDHLSFSYDGADSYVLKNLELSFQKGDAVGLIGSSGAGKSTVADIILGLLTPESGKVMMDGTDIRSIPDTWCRTIGYVPQSVYILNDTIRRNVAFGVSDADINDADVWHALEQAQLSDFVRALKDGLDTMLGDRGIRFSGGQRQRIAIARALYYNPEILLLDEATSALDTKTEESVMEAIDMLHGRKTLIIVAHRLSTIEKCNHIFEIVDGKAVERSRSEVFGENV